MFLYFKKNQHNHSRIYNHKHEKFLIEIPKIAQKIESFKILYNPKEFNNELIHAISHAHKHIYLVTLYLENDQGGNKIIDTILHIKKIRPTLKIKIIVDWHRAQRARIGETLHYTNINWYNDIMQKNPNIDFSIYGIPININEILGVLHLKGFIIDDKIIYSGASLNNEYLHIHNKYRYDRYHLIQNQQLSKIMLNYIDEKLLNSNVVKKIGSKIYPKKNKKKKYSFVPKISTKNILYLSK